LTRLSGTGQKPHFCWITIDHTIGDGPKTAFLLDSFLTRLSGTGRKPYFCWITIEQFSSPDSNISELLKSVEFGDYYQLSEESLRPLKSIFKNVMDPTTLEEVRSMINAQPNKAPGKSQINAALLKNLPENALELLTLAFNTCLQFSILPKAWLTGLIFPTPKGSVSWDASTTNTRPITLLEILQKCLVGIITVRIRVLVAKHEVLKGKNFSVLPGTSPDDVLVRINAMMEYAREFNLELWIILLDIKRAFDSVDYKLLEISLRRLGLPENYISWINFMNTNRSLQIITQFGLTDPFKQGGGIPQGNKDSPDLWLFVWDTLLVAIHNKFPGFAMTAITNHPLQSQRETITAKNVANSFVDDTFTVGNGLANAQLQVDFILLFLKLAGTGANEKKTKLIVLNESQDTIDQNLVINDKPITRSPPNQGERLLGVYINGNAKNKTQDDIIREYVASTTASLCGKPLTDEQITYILNAAIIPKLAYMSKGSTLTAPQMSEIDTKLRQLVKQAISLSKSHPDVHLTHTNMYGVRSLKEIVETDGFILYQKHINQVTEESMIREINLANALNQTSPAYATTETSFISAKTEKLHFQRTKMLNLMAENQISLSSNDFCMTVEQKQLESTLHPLIEAIKDRSDYHVIIAKAIDRDARYLDQLLSNNGQFSRSWLDFKALFSHKTRKNRELKPPAWFLRLIQALVIEPDVIGAEPDSLKSLVYLAVNRQPIKLHLRPQWLNNPFFDPEENKRAQSTNSFRKTLPRNSKTAPIYTSEPVDWDSSTDEDEDPITLYKKIEFKEKKGVTLPVDLDLNIKDFLDDAVLRNETILIYTDGSCRNADTSVATAGSGLFLIMENDYNEFISEYVNTSKPDILPYKEAFAKEYTSLGNTPNAYKTDKERKQLAGDNLFHLYRDQLLQSNYKFIEIHGEIEDGPFTSWYGEYMAVHKALYYVRYHKTLKIRILVDHKASADQFSVLTRSTLKAFAAKTNLSGLNIWSAIRKLERLRTRYTNIEWIEAHVGFLGNSFADHLAGLYGSQACKTTLPFVCPIDQSDHSLRTVLTYKKGTPIQETPRKLFNTINSVSKNHVGLAKVTQLDLPERNEWSFTLPIINVSCKVTSNTGSRPISQKRSGSFKKLGGILPTQKNQHRNNPQLYPNPLCRLCHQAAETNIHMWEECQSNLSRQSRKVIKDDYKKDILRLLNPLPEHLKWATDALEHIPCVSENPPHPGILHLGNPIQYIFPRTLFPRDNLDVSKTHFKLAREIQNITISQLAGGLLPTCLVETIALMVDFCYEKRFPDANTRNSPTRKQTINRIYSIQKTLYEDFHEYWLERCMETIKWEKEYGITPAAKKRKREKAIPTASTKKTKMTTRERWDKKIERRELQFSLTQIAMGYVLRKPKPHKHSQFIHDYSKKTVRRRIKSGIRAIQRPETKEIRRRRMDLKSSLPELPPSNIIVIDDSDDDRNPPRRRPQREPPDTW
jgi:ribonuclease HI